MISATLRVARVHVMTSLSYEEKKRLASVLDSFDQVYRRVTLATREHWILLRRYRNNTEARWLGYLVYHFRKYYLRWPDERWLGPYLRIFLGQRVTRLVRLSGWVYLHVAHDLPLVIDRSLDPDPHHDFPPRIERNSARGTFMLLNPDFPLVLHQAAKRGELGLSASIAGRLVGAKSATTVLAQWVVALRMISWTYGEMLHDAGGATDADRERLALAVTNAAEKAAAKFWIFGLPIGPPSIFVAALPFFGAQVLPDVSLAVAAIAAIGTVAVIWWWRYEARVINYLGYMIFVEMSRAMDEFVRRRNRERF